MVNTDNDKLPEYYTIEDISKIFDIHRITAGKLVRSDGFPCINIGRSIRVPRLLLNQWIIDHLFDETPTIQSKKKAVKGDDK